MNHGTKFSGVDKESSCRLALLPIEEAMALASVAGAAASSVSNRSPDGVGRKICEAVCGALVGIFCGPMIADGAGIANEHGRMGTGFAVGAGGALLLTFCMDYLKSGSWKEWLGRFAKPPVPPL